MRTAGIHPRCAKVFPIAILLAYASLSAAPAQEAPLTLEQLEAMALANNPTLGQARADIEASRGRARDAGAFPNPIVGYSAEEMSFGPVIQGGEHGVFVEQTIPLGGKRGLARDVFLREASEAETLAELQQQRILTTVRTLYYEALAAERRVEVNERLAQLVGEATTVTRQLYNVGAADHPDVLETDVEGRRVLLQLERARNRRFAIWRRLAAAVGDPGLRPRPLAGTIEAAIPELERDAALRTVLERSPQLAAARATVERARAVLGQARRETFPDLFLRGGVNYNRELLETRGPANERRRVGWEGTLEAGVSLPLFNRNQGGISAARAEQSRAELEVRRIELALESRFSEVFEQYLTALRASETYRAEMLPRAEEAYRLYLARYREMAAAYPQVLIAQRSLLELTDEYLQTLDEAWRAALIVQGLLVEGALEEAARPGEAMAMDGGRR
jgi:cobalt-zinc-cadmium efflux system outer membrane protein